MRELETDVHGAVRHFWRTRTDQSSRQTIADAQAIPSKFLEHILADLRRAGLLVSQRGSDGGYRLARPAAAVTIADVMRAVEGPLANVQGVPPDAVVYDGSATALRASRTGPSLTATSLLPNSAAKLPRPSDVVSMRFF